MNINININYNTMDSFLIQTEHRNKHREHLESDNLDIYIITETKHIYFTLHNSYTTAHMYAANVFFTVLCRCNMSFTRLERKEWLMLLTYGWWSKGVPCSRGRVSEAGVRAGQHQQYGWKWFCTNHVSIMWSNTRPIARKGRGGHLIPETLGKKVDVTTAVW